MEVYPDMRKIKRWKQGIAVAGVIALTGSLLAGCGGADGKNSGSKGETGSSNQAGNADTADLVNVNTIQMVKKQKMRAQKQWDVFWKMILQYLKTASF
mgnify:CR=1 FL=1